MSASSSSHAYPQTVHTAFRPSGKVRPVFTSTACPAGAGQRGHGLDGARTE